MVIPHFEWGLVQIWAGHVSRHAPGYSFAGGIGVIRYRRRSLYLM